MSDGYGEDGDFKSRFNRALVERIAAQIAGNAPKFDADAFVGAVDEELESLEMKARAKLIARQLHAHLDGEFPQQIDAILPVIGEEGCDDGLRGFDIWPMTQFVQMFGLDHFDVSLNALNRMTRVFSAEFAVRPFFVRYPDRMMELMLVWTQDDSEHVRRLVSEGSRPRLPWGLQLKQFIEAPRTTLPLLETLKDDPSEYVRRSVANHLNDIAKDHPEVVVDVTDTWMRGASKDRQRLVKHALRTLVKTGDSGALRVLGFRPDVDVSVQKLAANDTVQMPGKLEFEFELTSNESDDAPVIVDFIIHHVKKNGARTPKVFKLKQMSLKPGKSATVRKAHTFKPITTRTYYSGPHLLEVVVNGQVGATHEFHLEAKN